VAGFAGPGLLSRRRNHHRVSRNEIGLANAAIYLQFGVAILKLADGTN